MPLGDNQGTNGLFTYNEVVAFVDLIRGEAMELVEMAPDSVRSEFGFGMVHGFLKAGNRFRTLVDEALANQQQREEDFEKEF
jgi:hypothetical protein